MKKKIQINLINQTKRTNLPRKKQFEQWIAHALQKAETQHEITICIVGPAKSAALNAQYRCKSGPTNVLSFETIPVPGEQTYPLGDLVICAQLVAKEAKQAKKKVLAHWAHLTIHGTLHLQGYDHQKPREATVMENLESKIMQKLGFPDPHFFTGNDYEK